MATINATRFYFTARPTGVGVYEAAANGDWDFGMGNPWNQHRGTTLQAFSSKTGGGRIPFTPNVNHYLSCNQQPDYDQVYRSWLIGPLTAQTISGTYNHCIWAQEQWLVPTGEPADLAGADVRFKVHITVVKGFTGEVRGTLVDNYVDTAGIPTSGINLQFATPPTMTPVTCEDGDYVLVETGFRTVSSPTPTPRYYPDETWFSTITMINDTGTTNQSDVVLADAVPGTNPFPPTCAWMDFSGGITYQDPADVAAPANDACADAVVISSLPYSSPRINTVNSADTDKAVWYTYTAEKDGQIILYPRPSNYPVRIRVYTGGCALTGFTADANNGFLRLDVTTSTTYTFRITTINAAIAGAGVIPAPACGGSLQFEMFYREAPAEGDVYIPTGQHLAVFRDGRIVNYAAQGGTVSGIAIDYSGLTINNVNGGTNSGERLIQALFDIDFIDVLDLPSLGYPGNPNEIDWFDNSAWNLAQPQRRMHPATLHVRRTDNQLFVGCFGDGFLWIAGQGTSGTSRPSIMSTVSDTNEACAIKQIGVNQGDANGASVATQYNPTYEVTSCWAITMDDDAGVIYFTSGGYYVPLGGDEVRAYDLNTGVTSTFATIPNQPGDNPGMKGLQFLPGGGLLVCNSTVVHRLNSSGSIIGTYTPTVPEESKDLTDVKLTPDGTKFWAYDNASTHLFLVDIETMTEITYYKTWMGSGAFTQMAVYYPNGIGTPPGTETSSQSCPDVFLTDPPAKAIPSFLRPYTDTRRAQPAPSGGFTFDPTPSTGFKSRFRG